MRSWRFGHVPPLALGLICSLVLSVIPAVAGTIGAADHLLGYGVQSAEGTALGEVVGVFVDLENGWISYLLVAGESGREIVVPWRAARVLPGTNTLRLTIDADRFRQIPLLDTTEIDREKGRSLHRYFGVAPYWENEASSKPRPPRNLRIVK